MFQNGAIIQKGTYANLVDKKGVFQDLIASYGQDKEHKQDSEKHAAKVSSAVGPSQATHKQTVASKIFEEEERLAGGISLETWLGFARYCGSPWWALLVLILFVLNQSAQVGSSL